MASTLHRAKRRQRSAARRVVTTTKQHWPLLVVLAVAGLVRIAAEVAFRPALFFSDSWGYLATAYGTVKEPTLQGWPVDFSFVRPSGYPLLIDAISLIGRAGASTEDAVLAVTTLQHAAGLAAVLVVYSLLYTLSVGPLSAAIAAAVVGLDSYAIAVEQHLMPEAFFTTMVITSVWLAITRGNSRVAIGASGALLASAITLRTAAIFIVPLWAAYLLVRHRRLRVLAVGALAFAVPILAYASWQGVTTGYFGLTQANGWFLYARVGEIADCRTADIPRAARPLCRRTEQDRRNGATYHLWWSSSPAYRLFGRMGPDRTRQARSDRTLRDFAFAIIRDRPLEYARLVTRDFLRYFQPGVGSRYGADVAISFRRTGRGRFVSRGVKAEFLPQYEPPQHAPAKALDDFEQVVHVPRWLLAALALASVGHLALGPRPGRRWTDARRPEVLLLSGSALAMLLGTAAVSDFDLRYLLPAVPLLVCGGFVASRELLVSSRSRGAESGSNEESSRVE